MNGQEPIQPPPLPDEDAGSQALAEALRSSFFIVKIIMVVLVLAFLGSGIFTVGPQQRAIVLRLGKPVGEGAHALLNPGFHWAFPNPIDEIVKIPFTSLQTADSSVGWYLTPEERERNATPPSLDRLDPASTSYALTADTNIIHVVAAARYRITDPVQFYFGFTNTAVFVTNALNNALLFAASQFPVDDILTKNRIGFREAVTARVRDLVEGEHLGITIETPLGVDVSPPVFLVDKFNAVDTANVKRDNARAQAESYATTALAEARGAAATRTNEAESARSRLVSMVSAEAKKFTDVRAEYERNPEFYQRLRQMNALEQIYKNVQEKILEPHLSPRELRLNLGREPQGPSTNSASPITP
jgi:modulator of FtsH protease HflK